MRVNKGSVIGVAAIVLAAIGNVGIARANTILWISDANGYIGQVDITAKTVVAGSVHNTGLGKPLTDIAFVGDSLFGTTFSGLYSLNPTTGAATAIGSPYTVGLGSMHEGEMNALVGQGSSLLAASYATSSIYSLNPSNASATTFASSLLGFGSAGDLAFHGNMLYESGVDSSGNSHLLNVTTGGDIGYFHTTTTTMFNMLYGLADDGNVMYAVNGKTIYSVNLANALLTPLFTYSDGVCPRGTYCLAAANGMAFMQVDLVPQLATPLPGALPLFATGLGVLGFIGWRRKRKAAALSTRVKEVRGPARRCPGWAG